MLRLLTGARVGVIVCATVASACASRGPVATAVPAVPPPPSLDTKLAWVSRLEQQRVVRDADAPALADPVSAPVSVARDADLTALVRDENPHVRWRAAIALGRLKRADGRLWLEAALTDPVLEVREAAAFGLGILGDRQAVAALVARLSDAAPSVRARAIEALGLIGDAQAAPQIVSVSATCPGVLATLEPDAEPADTAWDAHSCRLALFALVRLRHYEGIARLTLDERGQPVSRWWPVAFALQRIADPRAAAPLRVLASTTGLYTPGFALRGLTELADKDSAAFARSLAAQREADVKTRIAAVRLVGRVGVAADSKILATIVTEVGPASPLGLEAIAAIGALADPSSFETLIDLIGDPAPAVRAEALAAAARVNPDAFAVLLSGLNRDRDWSVRAALAPILATWPAARATGALLDLANDEDARVHGPALEALAKILPRDSPELQARLTAALGAEDFVARQAAARLLGETKPAGAAERLVDAYARAEKDVAYGTRGGILDALAAIGGDLAVKTLVRALGDHEWPIRTKAATLLAGLGQTGVPLTPAPTRQPDTFFASEAFLHPKFSPRAIVDTRHGTIEIALDVVAAPVTVSTFIELARDGFFNGIKVHRLVPTFVIQAGDPRGDGEGGPGFTMRDELSPVPYVRGTVGMALDWADTAGSQWFIALSPQPHLDGRYTVFGKVVSGWEVLDRVSRWDAIERVRIWDGIELR